MPTSSRSSFSSDGKLFASAAEDGTLKIWDTSENIPRVNYNLKSHVNQTCSSLLWGTRSSFTNSCKKSADAASPEHSFLAIGTESGVIFLFDVNTGTLHSHFDQEHTDIINGFCWDPNNNNIYSCSNDSQIVIWDYSTGKVKSKWKADVPVLSLCLVNESALLSSSGTSISWWNLETKSVLRTFDGHKKQISSLMPVVSTSENSNTYFLSAAFGESKINAWNLNLKNSKTPVASFKLPDSLQNIDVTKCFSKEKPMLLSVVTEEGSLVMFRHVLNGRAKRNLTPHTTINVVSKAESGSTEAKQLPIISSKPCGDSGSCIIAYGSNENPIFEEVDVSNCAKKLILSRDASLSRKNSRVTTVKLSNKFNQHIHILNGQDSQNQSPTSSPRSKRGRNSSLSSVNDSDNSTPKIPTRQDAPSTIVPSSVNYKKKRLLSTESLKEASQDSPTPALCLTDSSSVVSALQHCINVADGDLFNMVISDTDEELIKSSVRVLPRYSLKTILDKLHRHLSSPEERYSQNSRRWIREILETHLSYLSNSQDINSTLQQIKTQIDAQRVSETLSQMHKLRGLLNICRIQGALNESSDTSESEEERDAAT